MTQLFRVEPSDVTPTVATPVEPARRLEEPPVAGVLSGRMAEFRAYYAMTPAIMHSIDAQGRIVEVSDLWLRRFGYRRDDVIGKKSVDFLTERSRRHAIEVVLPAFWRARRCERVPYEMVAADGAIVEVELSAELVEISGHEISLAVLEDVSERNAAARRLQEANDALRQFAGLASHDLRGPLGKIARLSDLLRHESATGRETPAERNRLLGRIGDTAREMSALVDAILDLSSGAERADQAGAAPLTGVIDEALRDLVADIEDAGATIVIDIDPDSPLPSLKGDARLLRHLFANLVDNALKHSGRHSPTVFILARVERDMWRIEVSDNGEGVAALVADALFRDRVRGDQSVGGVGMGMLLAKRIVDGHGGRIELAPSTEGARFVISLPACA